MNSGTASVVNSGTIQAVESVTASSPGGAFANTFGGLKNGFLPVAGVAQFLTGTNGSGGPGDLVKASVVNSGIIAANGSAAAGGRLNQAATYAEANADAFGVVQQLRGAGVETAAVTNSGLIRAVASASSDGHGNSDLEALAVGISQDFSGVSDEHSSVLNTETGVIEATARAKALGTGDMAAGAFAIGIAATDFGPPGINFDVSIVNRGQIKVAATASGSGDEFARAAGVFVNTEGPVGGLIKNTGSIYARAVANHGGAGALGIFDLSTANNTHIVNNGLILCLRPGHRPPCHRDRRRRLCPRAGRI